MSHIPYQKTQTHGIQRRKINKNLPQVNSITLSQYLYNAPLLGSASTQAKNEMGKKKTQIFQHYKHNIGKSIGSVQNRTNCHHSRQSMCYNVVERILKDPTHPIT
jgi:hypothetical protein